MVKLYYYFQWNKGKSNYYFISDSMEWYSWASSDEHILYADTCSSSQWHSKHFLWSRGWPLMAVGSTVSQNHFFPKFGGSKW